MKFVLCSDETYKDLYQKESYKYLRVEDHTSLAGYSQIWVNVHPCWMEDYDDERIHYLEQQLIALADFGYIKLAFIDEDGVESLYKVPQEVKPFPSEGTSQHTLYPTTPKKEVLSESDRLRLMEQEDGCAGGACTI